MNQTTATDTHSVDWASLPESEKLFPDTTYDGHFGWYAKASKIDHPFLQKLIDVKAVVTIEMGEWTVFGYECMALLKVYKDFINLECVTTVPESRHKGLGTKFMQAFIAVSNETGIPIRLRAAKVTGRGPGWMIPDHPVIAMGKVTTNRIRLVELRAWYEKLGFVLVGCVKQPRSYNMLYTPKTNSNEQPETGTH